MCTQVPDYVGLIRCPSSEVLCNNDRDRSPPSSVDRERHVSYQQLLVTTVVDDVTSSAIHSHGEFAVFDSYIHVTI